MVPWHPELVLVKRLQGHLHGVPGLDKPHPVCDSSVGKLPDSVNKYHYRTQMFHYCTFCSSTSSHRVLLLMAYQFLYVKYNNYMHALNVHVHVCVIALMEHYLYTIHTHTCTSALL